MERKWWTLVAACTAVFMLLLDVTIVNVALPNIQRDLVASFSELQWVVDAYALTLAALLLTAGALGDKLGHRKLFSTGLVLFTVSSLACGLASTATVLDLMRGAQGIGAAMLFATSLALIANAFHGPDRGKAFGIWGAVTGVSVAVGPVLGGVLTESVSWQSIFFLNIPVGIVALAITLRKVDEVRNPNARRVDWPGLVTFTVALFALVLAMIESNEKGWGSTLIVGLLALAAAGFAAFGVIESRVRQPMLELSLFRSRTFVGASIVAFALSASIFAMFLYISLYLQNLLGYSPLEGGLRILPLSAVAFVGAAISGTLSERVPARYPLGFGLLLVSLGLFLMHGIGPTSAWTTLLPGFLIAGAGIGLVNPPLASTAVSVVEPQRAGMASGINSTFRQVGIATGIAALGAIFQSKVAGGITSGLAGTPVADRVGEIGDRVAGGDVRGALASVPASAREAVGRAVRSGFVDGLNDILLVGAGVALLGGLLALALVRTIPGGAPGAPAASAEPARNGGSVPAERAESAPTRA